MCLVLYCLHCRVWFTWTYQTVCVKLIANLFHVYQVVEVHSELLIIFIQNVRGCAPRMFKVQS